MKKEEIQKKIVLGLLFVFPIVVYLFFASGKNNFAKLPILTNEVNELSSLASVTDDSIKLQDRITVLGYWGGSLDTKKAEALNLNEKIYKRFYEFEDFQFVILVNEERLGQVDSLKTALQEGVGTKLVKWNFISATNQEIQTHFNALKSTLSRETNGSVPYVFIIDKDRNLRGRNDDENEGTLYGFDARSVAQLNKKMIDDVKVILAEYRLALKIYNSNREK